ncbi:MAG: SprT family zinc-dependent metalloprotease [bacterium]
MNIEKSSIPFGNTVIEFAVRRRRWRRTISLFVDPHEGVYLRAPMRASIGELGRMVREKASWILKKQREFRELEGFKPKREFVSGETFLYLGKSLILKVLPEEGRRSVGLLDGHLLVSSEEKFPESERAEKIRELLTGWYRWQAQAVFSERMQSFSEKFCFTPAGFKLGNATRRWGSCNGKGEVRVTWQVVMAPMELVDYVIVHELCHLKHCNHSKRFWRLLGSILPDYEERRRRLRKDGPLYHF